MPHARQLLLALACLLLIPATGQVAEHDVPPPANHLHLSPALLALLQQEMNAILEGMQALVPAIVTGNLRVAADIGEQIQHSYIMQQRLTAAQREELQRELPPAFQELDRSFHHAAGKLAQAAKQDNAEVAGFYFHKLTETCIACHTRFAGYRFTGLAGDAADREHRH